MIYGICFRLRCGVGVFWVGVDGRGVPLETPILHMVQVPIKSIASLIVSESILTVFWTGAGNLLACTAGRLGLGWTRPPKL